MVTTKPLTLYTRIDVDADTHILLTGVYWLELLDSEIQSKKSAILLNMTTIPTTSNKTVKKKNKQHFLNFTAVNVVL